MTTPAPVVEAGRALALVRGAADAILTLDGDGFVVEANAAAVRLHGGSQADLVGVPVGHLVGSSCREQVAAMLAAVVAGDPAPQPADVTVVRRDGSSLEASLRLAPMASTSSDVVISVIIRDISSVLTEQRALEASERRYRARFEQSTLPQMFVTTDGRIADANRAFCDLLGVERSDLVGTPTTQWHHPSDGAPGVSRIDQVMSGEVESASWERIYRHRDGRGVPVLVHGTLVRDAKGRPDHVATFAQDLSLLRRAEQHVAHRTARFEALMAQAAEYALVLDDDATLLYASPSVQSAFGYDGSSIIGRSGWEFVHPDDRPIMREVFARVIAAPGATETAVFRLLDSRGAPTWVEHVLTNRIDHPGIRGILINGRDVSDRVASERALRSSEARYRMIAETAQEGIWATDMAGNTLFANRKLAEILGRPLDDIYNTPAPLLLTPEDPALLADKLRHGERGAEVYELDYHHPDGGTRTLRASVSPLRDGDLTGSLAMVGDITDVRRVEAELARRALHDELTGLANRTLLIDRLDQALARQSRDPDHHVAVLFIDLDNFKLVNDSSGHAVGDQLLVQVAERISAAVRPGDTVSRFGGDEFVVVCERVDEDAATEVARRVVGALSDRFEVAGQALYPGASIGVALSPAPSAGELLRFADAAMYDAKARGRGRAQVFDVGLAQQAADRLELGHDLRRALESDELTLHYQPVVDVNTGELVGVEALARWVHPVRGAVPPAQFVRIAEATGLGAVFDAWVLRRGASDIQVIRDRIAMPVPVAVNVSAANLTDPALHGNLIEVLSSLRLPHDLLILEITENALMEHPERARDTLRHLAELGITTAIDDFGTGYSSLAYLNQLPVQTLKIDRSFITNLDDDDAFAIVAAVVDLARTLGLRTVGEGIETRDQLALLRRLGCTAGQGYLWSPPLPLDDLCALMLELPQRRFDVVAEDQAPRRTARRASPSVTADHGLAQIMRMHRDGASLATIASALNAEGFRTPQGSRWHRATVARVISDLAYPQLSPRG